MEPSKEAIETVDENGWTHRRCEGEVGENSKMIGGVLCRWWGTEEPEGVKTLNNFTIAALQQELFDASTALDDYRLRHSNLQQQLKEMEKEVERLRGLIK